MKFSRRQLLGTALAGGAATLGFAGLRVFWNDNRGETPGYGQLVADPNRLLDLPQEFRYQVLSRTSDPMTDGFRVPGAPDGMAAFPGPQGRTILVRNHELTADALSRSAFGSENEWRELNPALIYDPVGGLGGTTTLVYDTKRQKLERQYLSLIGTVRNCAGGSTPWNTWVSCEESVQRIDEKYACDHGFNFEVPASARELVRPVPLKAMGRFNHEAICVDAATGIVYQTEDRGDGLFYRFVPDEDGKLASGGKLQALKIIGREGVDTSNHDALAIESRIQMPASWIDLEEVESPEDDLRLQGFTKGAARFARGEGVWSEPGSIYFAATSGGAAKCGQIWKYAPKAATLELFAESPDALALEKPDNISIAPWGDLLICEDGPEENRVVGITPEGRYYTLARNAMNDSEITGGVFSPDGTTFFINIQDPGITFAITGPWKSWWW
jgi:secreted PhoX family phosphatase